MRWIRTIAGGMVWAVAYNALWGAAWFAFMRTAWRDAFAAIGSPMAFTSEVWTLWITLTLPIGIAVVAYTTSPTRSEPALRVAIYSGATLWLLMTLGMMAWAWRESLPARIVALDSFVNLVAMVSASLLGTWCCSGMKIWNRSRASGSLHK